MVLATFIIMICLWMTAYFTFNSIIVIFAALFTLAFAWELDKFVIERICYDDQEDNSK